MNAEVVHDDHELRRLWHAANPGVTPTPWDGPPARPALYLMPTPLEQLPLALPPAEPINLAEYRRQRRPESD